MEDRMKRVTLLAALLLTMTAEAQIGITRIKRQLETSAPQDIQLNLRHGETVDYELQFLSYRQAMDITGATVTLHATTNGMPDGTSFQISGTAGSNGTATVRIVTDEWLPYGLTSGTWTMEVSQPTLSKIMRASGSLRVSGLYYPSTNSPLPVTWSTNLWSAIATKLDTNNATYLATVASASTALQPADTNGWTVSSHVGLATTAQLGSYLPLAGGTMTGDITFLYPNGGIKSWDALQNPYFTRLQYFGTDFWAGYPVDPQVYNCGVAIGLETATGYMLAVGGRTRIDGDLVVTNNISAVSVTLNGADLQTTLAGKVDTSHTGNVRIIGGLIAGGLSITNAFGARNEVVVSPTNNADLLRVELEPGANVTGAFIGRPGAVVPPGANGSYMCYIKAPASGTYNHALGLEAGKSNGEILHLYNKDQKHVARFNTDANEELEVRWGRPDGGNQLYWLGGLDPYMVIGTNNATRAGTSMVTVRGNVDVQSLSVNGTNLTTTLASKVGTDRTITVNGSTGTLSSNLSFTVSTGLTSNQVSGIANAAVHGAVFTNQSWYAPNTNIQIRVYWDTTNGTFAVEEILP
jgi:hypothetical protein